MRLRIRYLLMSCMFLLVACSGAKTLTRYSAQSVLSRAQMKIGAIKYTNLYPKNCLIQAGFAFPHPFGMGYGAEPNDIGKAYIQSIEWSPTGLDIGLSELSGITILQITGMTDALNAVGGSAGDSIKTVDFTARMDLIDFPATLKPCLDPGQTITGHATLQLYDDGWRLKSWTLDPVIIIAPNTNFRAPTTGSQAPDSRSAAGVNDKPWSD